MLLLDVHSALSTRHALRISGLLQEDHGGTVSAAIVSTSACDWRWCQVLIGGECDPTNAYVAPTIVLEPKADSQLMNVS